MSPTGGSPGLRELIQRALAEDVGRGDLTTGALFTEAIAAEARILARQDLVVSGLDALRAVFLTLDPALSVETLFQEGDRARNGDVLARLRGDGRSILTAERVALNFIQHLSGIATYTALFIEALKGFKTRLLDTRKTLPGWRNLEKQAVRAGGGLNHRMGLDDAILIKDNHIALYGGAGQAVRAARKSAPPLRKVLIEARTPQEVDEVVRAGADWILLDNMTPEELRAAVERIKGRAITEASGGVSLDTVREIAATGVDFISVGALTHSARAADISLVLTPLTEGGEALS